MDSLAIKEFSPEEKGHRFSGLAECSLAKDAHPEGWIHPHRRLDFFSHRAQNTITFQARLSTPYSENRDVEGSDEDSVQKRECLTRMLLLYAPSEPLTIQNSGTFLLFNWHDHKN